MDLRCRNRLTPLSSEGIAVLTDIVGHHAVVNDRRSDGKMVARKTEAWEEIATAFNATGVVKQPRTAKQVKKIWDRIKSRAKDEYDHFKPQVKKTGGGPPPAPYPDGTAKVLDLIRGELDDDGNNFDSDSPDLPPVDDQIDESGVEDALTKKKAAFYEKAIEIEEQLLQERLTEAQVKRKAAEDEAKLKIQAAEHAVKAAEHAAKAAEYEAQVKMQAADYEAQVKKQAAQYELEILKIKKEKELFEFRKAKSAFVELGSTPGEYYDK